MATEVLRKLQCQDTSTMHFPFYELASRVKVKLGVHRDESESPSDSGRHLTVLTEMPLLQMMFGFDGLTLLTTRAIYSFEELVEI